MVAAAIFGYFQLLLLLCGEGSDVGSGRGQPVCDPMLPPCGLKAVMQRMTRQVNKHKTVKITYWSGIVSQ